MDVWNYTTNAANVAWNSIGSNLSTGVVWTVVDYLNLGFVRPVLNGAVPGGALGTAAFRYYDNIVSLTKLALWR